MRSVALACAVVASAVAAGVVPADAARERDAQIRLSVGIGKIRLGMTLAQVRRILGPPQLLNRRVKLAFGREHREYVWNWYEWSVAFRGRPGQLRVVRVATTLRGHRYRGLGVGSRPRELLRVFPNATCRGYLRLNETHILVRTPGGRQLLFKVAQPPMRRGRVEGPLRVAEVIVQETLPTLGVQIPGQSSRLCTGAWRTG